MILVILVATVLIAAIISAISKDSIRIKTYTTLISSIITLWLSIRIALDVVTSSSHIITAIPYWISIDGLGALIVLLVSVVYFTASIFSIGYMKFDIASSSKLYYVNFNLFVFSMLIIPLIKEPNTVWIAVELTTLFSVLLVGFENTNAAIEAAWKYIVLTIMGAAIALLGFLILYWAARQAGVEHYTWSALLIAAPQMSPVLLKASFIFILVGFGAKIGLVPLHTWLPDAHSQAPSPVCALLSGVETTAILYVILRLLPIMSASLAIDVNTWLSIIGLISVGTAAFLLLQVKDYKRLFAFSTVEHMGIILVAFGLGGASAHIAAVLQMIGHTLTKSFAFYAAGSVLLIMGTRDIASVRNLIKKSPISGVALLLGGLAIAGAPPFVLFLSEFSIIKAGLSQGKYIIVGILVLFIAIAFFAIMNHVSRMVFGKDEKKSSEQIAPVTLPISTKITLGIAIIPIVIFGVYIPETLNKLIILAAAIVGGS
ncbi:MAG: hypothetical protein GXP61_07470 [Epsilonproteobacteria bacterium]|nr:hypothetical protein [Campylobacterota bacterium]